MTPSSSDDLFANLSKTAEEEDAPVPGSDSVDNAPIPQPDELTILKQRAKLMGVTFSNNIGVDALRAKINAKLEGEKAVQETKAEVPEAVVQAKVPTTPAPRKESPRQKMVREQMRLIRLRITNLNPSKKDLPGEIFTVANGVLGTVRKFIPYGEATDNGYHVPYIIYKQLKDREFQVTRTRKNSQGHEVVETYMAREFALEELPQLTPKELAQLAAAQQAKGID